MLSKEQWKSLIIWRVGLSQPKGKIWQCMFVDYLWLF